MPCAAGADWAGTFALAGTTFHFNCLSLRQEAPVIDTSKTVSAAYYWTNLRWKVSSWTTTVQFADAWGDAHYIAGGHWNPFPGLAYTKYIHIWIQEDAWGNCTYFGTVEPDPWPF